jgi:uncharacterized membrane protein YccF (DUF307 family)
MSLELQIGAIALAPVIVAIIEVVKALGLPVKYAPWVSGALSVLGYALVIVVQRDPSLLEPIGYVLNALVIFLVATGFYNRAQATVKRIAKSE